MFMYGINFPLDKKSVEQPNSDHKNLKKNRRHSSVVKKYKKKKLTKKNAAFLKSLGLKLKQ